MLCLLAADEADIALQIHFTLIQAFCCANDIHILRASGLERLAAVLGENPPDDGGGGGAEPRDLHCLLVTVSRAAEGGGGGGAALAVGRHSGAAFPGLELRGGFVFLPQTPHTDSWGSQGLAEVARFCQESRCNDQWVPYVALQAR